MAPPTVLSPRRSKRLASLKPEAIVLGGDDITVDATSQYIQPSTVPPRVKTAVFYGDSDNAPEETKYDFVFTGYRYHYSTWEGLTGLFQLHYETVNIWTHLLGLVWYLAQFPHLREVLDAHGALPVDRLYYYGFLAAAVFQMATSTAYHMWRNMSQGAETALLRLDVLGVTAMIVGSYAVGLLNGFWCDPWLHVVYMGVTLAILAAGCGMMLLESFQDPRWMLLRNLVLALSVAFGLVPCAHWALVEHCDVECRTTFLTAMFKMFGFYGAGFGLFMYRLPERLAPGRFDLLGASHQWWHVGVWAAGSAWFEGMVRYFIWRKTALGSCPAGTQLGDALASGSLGESWWGFLAAIAGHDVTSDPPPMGR